MPDPNNPYSSPVADSGTIEPGYYQADARRRTWGEIWRSGPLWRLPLRLLVNQLLKPGPEGTFIYLPIVPSESWCAADEVPPAIHTRLVPLVAGAIANGFNVEHWLSPSAKGPSVSANGMNTGGVGMYDGRDTICAFAMVLGTFKKKHLVDRLVISFNSYHAKTGVFHSTKNDGRGFDHHRRVRLRVMTGADFPTLLRAHRRRLDRLGDCSISSSEYRRLHTEMNRQTWKERIDRGLFRRVCGTREELQEILAQRAQD